jgi:hypothetical protein
MKFAPGPRMLYLVIAIGALLVAYVIVLAVVTHN